MTRTLLSQKELESWLTAELRKCEGCEECEVMAVMPLRETDEEGCNWSRTLTIRATGVPQDILHSAFSNVMAKARSKFNLKETFE